MNFIYLFLKRLIPITLYSVSKNKQRWKKCSIIGNLILFEIDKIIPPNLPFTDNVFGMKLEPIC